MRNLIVVRDDALRQRCVSVKDLGVTLPFISLYLLLVACAGERKKIPVNALNDVTSERRIGKVDAVTSGYYV